MLNGLDQIAWLFNIRSHDIPYNPVAISYALIGTEEATFFTTPGKINADVKQALNTRGIGTAPYASLAQALQELPKDSVIMADGNTLNYSTFTQLSAHLGLENIRDIPSPVILKKAIKNPIEINGFQFS